LPEQEAFVSQQPEGDLQAELAALRQRIGDLEAKHRDSLRCASRWWRPGFSRKFLLSALPLVALLSAGGLLYAQSAGDALFIDTKGNVGVGTNAPKAQLDIQQGTRTNPTNHQPSVKVLYVTGDLQPAAGIEFRHSNGTQGIGFGYNTMYATGSNPNQDLNLKARGTGKVKVQGVLEGVGAVPTGAIVMWSGDPTKLPKGWILCDGQSGTPDLRSRFIVGYRQGDRAYGTVKATGGEAAHGLTLAELGHLHGVPAAGKAVGRHTHQWAGSPTTSAGANVTVRGPVTGAAGSLNAKAHENRPPYMVLAFIMYTGK
jgi:microcystin-dependent protein